MATLSICARPRLLAAKELLESVALPSSDLTEQHLEHFLYCGPSDELTGLVGLEIYGPHALLRSLAVAPTARSAGVGSALLSRAEAHARANAVRELYLLTTTAQAFFEARGYRLTSREGCPTAIRASSEFSSLCPASSALLLKHL
jgi:amino-acid N-acetyltransferase